MLLSVVNTISSAAQFITVLFLFLFVCLLTWFTTRFIASYESGKIQTANIDVIETYRIATNKYIQIIRTGEKYLAIAVCKDSVTFLCELAENELMIKEGGKAKTSIDFKDIFEKVKQRKKEKEQVDKDV